MIWLKKQSRGSIFFFFKSNFAFSKTMWPRLPSTKCPQKYFFWHNIDSLLQTFCLYLNSVLERYNLYTYCVLSKKVVPVFLRHLLLVAGQKLAFFQLFRHFGPLKSPEIIFFQFFPPFFIFCGVSGPICDIFGKNRIKCKKLMIFFARWQ